MTFDLPPLTNIRSDRVKAVRGLGRRAARDKQGKFLVEGPQSVRELIAWAPERALHVYVTQQAIETHQEMIAAAQDHGIPVQECSDEVLALMGDTQQPQGVLALAKTRSLAPEQVLEGMATDDFVVILTNVRDPGNAGTVIRGADAFGAAGVLVSDGSVDIHNPKVVRSTVGSLFHLNISAQGSVTELLSLCREAGVRTLAADGRGDVSLPDADLSGQHAWVMGNEAWGLPANERDLCDKVVSVPIVRAESLNLAMAATVCLHASAAARGVS
ncbi:RNA methyltransferase [Ornithinimicrobium sp. Arc0846-15]|nr:RNA methyltransferase [Ornithinimicrobium laminariae]